RGGLGRVATQTRRERSEERRRSSATPSTAATEQRGMAKQIGPVPAIDSSFNRRNNCAVPDVRVRFLDLPAQYATLADDMRAAVRRWLAACGRDGDTLHAPGGERVRAILPVHLFGRMCDVDALAALAADAALEVVEDAAQAIGARSADGRAAGAMTRFGCLSFYPTKNLGGAGDGGAVVCARQTDAATVRT